MNDLEEYIKNLSYEFKEKREKDFIKQNKLKRLAFGVYTDKNLVYKFFPEKTELQALKRAKGIKGSQQFVAYKRGVLVSKFVKSRRFKVGTKIPNNHLDALVETMLELRKRNISFRDCHLKNLLYSKKEGFTLIDLCNEENKRGEPYLPINDLVFFMTEKEPDINYLQLFNTMLNIIYDKNEIAAKKTLKKLINRKDIEYSHPFKKINYKTKAYKFLQNTFKRHCIRVKNIEFNRYEGTFNI